MKYYASFLLEFSAQNYHLSILTSSYLKNASWQQICQLRMYCSLEMCFVRKPQVIFFVYNFLLKKRNTFECFHEKKKI